MSRYKEGNVLKPITFLTGFAQIYKVQDIPEERLGYYSNDNSVKELYHGYTDFGNVFTFTEKEIEDHYEVVGNECVYDRMLRWKENVCRVVDDYEKGVVWETLKS